MVKTFHTSATNFGENLIETANMHTLHTHPYRWECSKKRGFINELLLTN